MEPASTPPLLFASFTWPQLLRVGKLGLSFILQVQSDLMLAGLGSRALGTSRGFVLTPDFPWGA